MIIPIDISTGEPILWIVGSKVFYKKYSDRDKALAIYNYLCQDVAQSTVQPPPEQYALDTKRLDWLENLRSGAVRMDFLDGLFPQYLYWSDKFTITAKNDRGSYSAPTLREAIDAAMDSMNKEPK